MKVFVSYKRDDDDSKKLLLLLQEDLAKVFTKVYSDRLLPAGDEWRQKLLQWIDRCHLFVVLRSEKAAGSEKVKEEVTSAYDRWIRTERKGPKIITVSVNYTEPFEGFWRDVGALQQLSWTGENDPNPILKEIRRAVAKVRRPRVYGAIAVLFLLALLAYITVIVPLTNIQKLRAASPATELLSEAKTYRDRGSHFGWSSRANAAYDRYLRRWSEGHLANARTNITQGKVQEGLLRAALVAQENGGKLDPSFLKDYEEGHYNLLKQTLRTGATLGAGLAVSSDGTQIAAGNALWNPGSKIECSLGTDAINAVAFGPRGLYTGGNEHVRPWTVCVPGAQFDVSADVGDLEDRVQYLAIAPDNAVAVVMRKGISVLLHAGGTVSQALKHSQPVRSIAFSNDGSLITTSGQTLNIWDRRESHPVPRTIHTGLSLHSASLKGDYVAVAGPRTVKVWRWRPSFQFQYEIPFEMPIRAVALSDDPSLLAVVTDGGVLLEQVAKDAFRLGSTQSAASDVVFSDVGRSFIVKRVDAVEIWNSDPSSTTLDAPPNNPLDDWTRKFGLTVDEIGHFKPILFKEDR
jgi:hypothetical protein